MPPEAPLSAPAPQAPPVSRPAGAAGQASAAPPVSGPAAKAGQASPEPPVSELAAVPAGSSPAPGSPAAAGLDKSGSAIRDMFGAVARRYDLLNHLLSGGLDLWWRRQAAAAALGHAPGSAASPLVLDLCAGTGDQAIALARRGARVAAADFCVPMLALARRKFGRRAPRPGTPRPRPLAADALALPFPSGRFAAAAVAFGLRNVADLDQALRELAAVLAPGGRLAVLEFAVPGAAPLRALYLFYFRRVLPRIGRLLSDSSSAYEYLPSSVLEFPQRRGFLDRMAAAGFTGLAWRDLAAGIVCLYTGSIPAVRADPTAGSIRKTGSVSEPGSAPTPGSPPINYGVPASIRRPDP